MRPPNKMTTPVHGHQQNITSTTLPKIWGVGLRDDMITKNYAGKENVLWLTLYLSYSFITLSLSRHAFCGTKRINNCGTKKIFSILFFYFFWIGGTCASEILEAGTFTCALQPDNTIICWGRFSPPSGTFSRLSESINPLCGIRTDGTLACWGGKQVDVPSGKFLQVSLGDEHGCGIREDNTMTCWGSNDYGQAVPPEGTFSQVTVGTGFSCAIRTDNTLICWGTNKERPQYPIITPTGTFSQVSASQFHVCGVRTHGKAVCWGVLWWEMRPHIIPVKEPDGINEGGEVLIGDARASPPAGTFYQMSGGSLWFTCGLKTDHSISCWGATEPGFAEPMRPPHGQCNYLSYDGGLCESPPGLFSQISAGSGLVCAVLLKDNSVLCWGYDENGSRTMPPPGLRVKSIEDSTQCLLYGVHDDGEQTQFFIINSGMPQVVYPRGDNESLNITALDIHPKTHRLYAASGKNIKNAKFSGSLYEVLNGAQKVENLGQSGFQEISALTFHPDGNNLWGWSPEAGLFKMDYEEETGPVLKTLEILLPYDKKKMGVKVELEDLTWNQDGDLLYGIGRILDDQEQGINKLWVYDPQENQVSAVCDAVVAPLGKITALETLPNGQFMLSFSDENHLNLWTIDGQTCEVIKQEAIPTKYKEVRGLAQPDCARPELHLKSLF